MNCFALKGLKGVLCWHHFTPLHPFVVPTLTWLAAHQQSWACSRQET